MKPTFYLSSRGVAERIGVTNNTISGYLQQGRLPKPDALIGSPDSDRPIRGWLPETIDEWNKNRPGRGARTDLKK